MEDLEEEEANSQKEWKRFICTNRHINLDLFSQMIETGVKDSNRCWNPRSRVRRDNSKYKDAKEAANRISAHINIGLQRAEAAPKFFEPEARWREVDAVCIRTTKEIDELEKRQIQLKAVYYIAKSERVSMRKSLYPELTMSGPNEPVTAPKDDGSRPSPNDCCQHMQPLAKADYKVRRRVLEWRNPKDAKDQAVVDIGNLAAHGGIAITNSLLFDDCIEVIGLENLTDTSAFFDFYKAQPAFVTKFQSSEHIMSFLDWRASMPDLTGTNTGETTAFHTHWNRLRDMVAKEGHWEAEELIKEFATNPEIVDSYEGTRKDYEQHLEIHRVTYRKKKV